MASHKRNFADFIEPNYGFVKAINPGKVRDKFQAFMDECLAEVPNEGKPADGYMYNSHMGEFARKLDQAKDEFCKALLAFHAERNSCEKKQEKAVEEKK